MSDIRSNYPFATRGNTAVPTAILKPTRFIKAIVNSAVLFTDKEEVVQCEAIGGPALLVFSSTVPTIVNNVPIENAMHLPWGARVLVAIPADISLNAYVIPLSNDTTHVYIQVVESWKSIDNQSSFARQF